MSFFDFRECIILFISVSVVGMILMSGNFTGNAFCENEIASSFPILCKVKLSIIVGENH
jgi:hypothetical protein